MKNAANITINRNAATGDTATHLSAMPPIAGDTDSLLRHAVLARTLLGDGGHGTLSTINDGGFPYGSLAAYSVDDEGAIWVCISELAAHTHNAQANPKAGLFVATDRPDDSAADPMNRPRVGLIGELRVTDASPDVIARHLELHPAANDYFRMPDFSFWRFDAFAARYIGGFGVMSWIEGHEVATAQPDPVLAASSTAVAHMNKDHGAANLAIVRHHAEIGDAEHAEITSIDHLGITFTARTPTGPAIARVKFSTPLDHPAQIRQAVIALAAAAAE